MGKGRKRKTRKMLQRKGQVKKKLRLKKYREATKKSRSAGR